MRRSLSATLHDAMLERVAIEDGLATLTFDVEPLRALLGADARLVLLARGSVSLAALAWKEPLTPWPSEAAARTDWPKLGTMRSLDWDLFAASLAASGLEVVEAELKQGEGARDVVLLGGSFTHPYTWVEVRVEANAVAFARETGEAIVLDALGALGEAYWEAWRATHQPIPP